MSSSCHRINHCYKPFDLPPFRLHPHYTQKGKVCYKVSVCAIGAQAKATAVAFGWDTVGVPQGGKRSFPPPEPRPLVETNDFRE